ncbi:MAG: phosphotransferase family protein [Myxococcota bacterium]
MPIVGAMPQTGPKLVDAVDTFAEAGRLGQPPLIVYEGLEQIVAGRGPVEFERIGGGHSNVTGLVRRDGEEWILRRPPRPPYPPRAHDVIRECTILEALGPTPVPVPRVALRCEDPRYIGAPFYLMERVQGEVLRAEIPPSWDRSDQEEIVGQLVDRLLDLHAVEPQHLGLPCRGGDTYLERQVAMWRDRWERSKVRELGEIDALGADLAASLPHSQRTTMVHGDYKLDNVVFAVASAPRLVAILDWEMATAGDPLADLGYLAAMWLGGGRDPNALLGLSRVTAAPGFPAAQALVERYGRGSDLDLEGLHWYEALAIWKLAILLEGSYRRYLDGTDDDEFFALLRTGVPARARLARDHFSRAVR